MKKNYDVLEDELTQILNKLDSSEISLEESLELYEKGVLLLAEAQNALKLAENKITLLTNSIEGIAVEKQIKVDAE